MTKARHFATIVSVLGVVLTAASVITSIAQYRAADLQAQTAIAALMPQLEVRSLLEKRDADVFTDRRLEVTSDGGPIYNFSTDRQTWFRITRGMQVLLEQPLIGYFAVTYSTGRIKGDMQTIIGHKNHEKFLALEKRSRQALPPYVDFSQPSTLLRVSYRDSLKRDAVEFFLVEGGSVTRLDAQLGDAEWRRMKQVEVALRAIDLDGTSSDSEFEEWLQRVRARVKPQK